MNFWKRDRAARLGPRPVEGTFASRFRALPARRVEAILFSLVFVVTLLGFLSAAAASRLQQQQDPLPALLPALYPALVLIGAFTFLHWLLRLRRQEVGEIILPVVALLCSLGLIMISRLSGLAGAWQQLLRGFIPGILVIAALLLWPGWIERIRRWAIPISVVGLLLPFLTALFGVVDETGARLALKLGPLPPIQTTELIKVALLIFLAWYIEREGQAVEGRAQPLLGRLRMPALHYFLPGALFVALATLALVAMSDFGAVLILGFIFIGMLYAGFETRVFIPVALIGLVLAGVVGTVLLFTWHIPTVIQYRFLAFMNPWSKAPILVNGQPSNVTISEGPGYQIQQAIYAVIAGGLSGTGLGFGNPDFVPLAASDFIFAAITEEMGALIALAVLVCFAVLLLRLFRLAMLLPAGQVFERLLIIGISIHLFTQVFIMVGGTLNFIPLTGVTVPFLSQGGMALLVNLTEIGLALAIGQRLNAPETALETRR